MTTPTKLLIVDDDSFVLDMLSSILLTAGYNVQTAQNGKEALAIIGEQPDTDLIISDMNMEEMSGLELIRQIREKGSAIPIIILTVNENVTIAIEALKSGASDYLLKDENIQETIPVAVERVMEKYLLQQRNIHNGFNLRYYFSDEQKEFIAIIHQTSGEMLTLLNDLLDISVIESGKLKLEYRDESLADLLLTRLRLNRVMARKKNITIKADLEDIPALPLDAARIAQVIDNLLSNAVKYSPPGSNVFVSLKSRDKMAEVAVRDEGPGIADEEKANLFNAYQRLSSKPTGGETSTGLGLAIVKKIIDAHQGKMELESSPGFGCCFIFCLPLAP